MMMRCESKEMNVGKKMRFWTWRRRVTDGHKNQTGPKETITHNQRGSSVLSSVTFFLSLSLLNSALISISQCQTNPLSIRSPCQSFVHEYFSDSRHRQSCFSLSPDDDLDLFLLSLFSPSNEFVHSSNKTTYTWYTVKRTSLPFAFHLLLPMDLLSLCSLFDNERKKEKMNKRQRRRSRIKWCQLSFFFFYLSLSEEKKNKDTHPHKRENIHTLYTTTDSHTRKLASHSM